MYASAMPTRTCGASGASSCTSRSALSAARGSRAARNSSALLILARALSICANSSATCLFDGSSSRTLAKRARARENSPRRVHAAPARRYPFTKFGSSSIDLSASAAHLSNFWLLKNACARFPYRVASHGASSMACV
eukprot:Amastigsp_a512819_15.p4 type:complete len:137 gc:universal Amastigsp_a512819_15:865-1275(+)